MNYSEQLGQLNNLEKTNQMSNTYSEYLEKYLRKRLGQGLNERDDILRTANNFGDEESLQEYIKYLLKNAKPNEYIQDDIDQLSELYKELGNLREEISQQYSNNYDWKGIIDHREQVRELPESVSIKIVKGKIYKNTKGPDYFANIKRVLKSTNLKDGLQNGENAQITLDLGEVDTGKFNERIRETINISYNNGILTFTDNYLNNYQIVINEDNKLRPIRVKLGDNIPRAKLGKKHGFFIKFIMYLDWR